MKASYELPRIGRAEVNLVDDDFGADGNDLGRPAPRGTSSQPRLFDVLLRRKRLILLAALIGAGIFAAYAYLAPPRYTAEALIITNQPEFGQEASPLTASRETQAAALGSEIDIIKSPAFVARVVDQFDLTTDPELNGSSGWFLGGAETGLDTDEEATASSSDGTIGFLIAYASVFAEKAKARIGSLFGGASVAYNNNGEAARRRHDAKMAQTTRTVSRHLSVSNDGHSVTIQIRFSSQDPYKASKLANAFADNYVEEKLETKQRQSTKINIWLDGRISELRTRVLAADRAVQEERQHLNISEAGSAGSLSDQTLVQWNLQLVAAQAKRLTAQARLATAKKMLTDPSPTQSTADILGSPVIQHLREQKSLLTATYASMLFRSRASYPPAMALQRQIDDLSESLRIETQKIVDSLANEVETARRDEAIVTDTLALAKEHASSSQIRLTTIRELEQRAASERVLYDQFLRKFNETLGHNYLPQSDARTVSSASPPDRPVYPTMTLFAPAGFLLGMFFGAVKALHSAGSERTFKASHTIEAATGLPTLALVPVQRNSRRGGPPALSEVHFEQSVARVAAILEQIRRQGQPSKVVAVTSALPQEGKTIFCAALARSATRSGKRVVVIEFDRYFPRLSEIFENPARSGDIMDLVAATKTLSEVVQRDRLSDVDFVPVTNRTGHNQQVVTTSQVNSVFRRLSDSYDLILVDTPPVLANADIATLADVIDTCLFLVRWGNTPRDAVAAALQQLRLLNVAATGVVLTGVNPAKADSDAEGHFYDQIKRYHTYKGAA